MQVENRVSSRGHFDSIYKLCKQSHAINKLSSLFRSLTGATKPVLSSSLKRIVESKGSGKSRA